MKLNVNNWKEYKVSDIFSPMINGKGITDREIKENPGQLVAVQSSSDNNACMGLIDEDYCREMNYKIIKTPCMTVARSGSAGYVSFQEKGCVIGDSAKAMILKYAGANKYHYLFLRTILMKNMYKFTYGRKVKADQYMDLRILLPSDEQGAPDWKYMEDYIKSLHYKPIATQSNRQQPLKLKIAEWEEYELGQLFIIKKGKRLTKADMIEGQDNYLGAIDHNNGIRQKITADRLWDANCITVNYNGSVGEAFYQSQPFWASDDVNVLYPNGWELNKFIGLFIVTVIKMERFKYNYGRKWTKDIMQKTKIKLPAKDGMPDFSYMEEYMKALPYSDRI